MSLNVPSSSPSNSSDEDVDLAIAFASIDFTGVDFNDDSITNKEGHIAANQFQNSHVNFKSEYETLITKEVTNQPTSSPTTCHPSTVVSVSLPSSSSSHTPITISSIDKSRNHSSPNIESESPVLYKTLPKVQVNHDSYNLSTSDERVLLVEKYLLLSDCTVHLDLQQANGDEKHHYDNKDEGQQDEHSHDDYLLVQTMSQQLSQGLYIPILEGIVAQRFFDGIQLPSSSSSIDPLFMKKKNHNTNTTSIQQPQQSFLTDVLRQRIFTYCHTVTQCIQLELLAVASFQLFLQFNYTGPTFDHGVDFQTGKVNSKLQQWLLQGEKFEEEDKEEEIISIQSRLERIYPHSIIYKVLDLSETHAQKVQEISSSNTITTNAGTMEKNEVIDMNIPPPLLSQHPTFVYKGNPSFQNAILSELAVEGEWPCPVCRVPYFLLLARVILQTLADPNRPTWSLYYYHHPSPCGMITTSKDIIIQIQKDMIDRYIPPSSTFVTMTQFLMGPRLWNARTVVAHTRLLQGDEAPYILWEEVQDMFQPLIETYCISTHTSSLLLNDDVQGVKQQFPSELLYQTLPTKLLLEYGLAQHFHEKNKKGKDLFQQALKRSGLEVTVTGSEGRRTKYQQKSTAQLLVRAKPSTSITDISSAKEEEEAKSTEYINKQLVDHPDPDENPLLDRVEYVDEVDNVHHTLSILHQAILLALCLDVKNENPKDGLTAEEICAYLERVLQQHDDWMVFATGLLERAWLEYERNHTKMRAILQIQALVDQHTHRLTITQSTVDAAIENSAPPQERLRNLHYIVYPPRWEMLRDLAERYAQSGIVISAAELFEEIELWDEVVECYRQAGKDGTAEQIVRSRLKENETPRMWTALGDISKDPSCYHRAIEVSRGRYAGAYSALGKYHSDKGELKEASHYYESALRIKPHSPHMWFRLGTIAMRLQDWSLALHSFTEVVQQEPEEGDAWANVAAIHMHNRRPDEAYPALVEVRIFVLLF